MKIPILYQRLEAAAILGVSLACYVQAGFNLWLLAILFFAFDLSMVGYLINPRVGAHSYNLIHALIGPALTIGLGFIWSNQLCLEIGLIWLAHIGLDRSVGYGLKDVSDFGTTHLGQLRSRASRPAKA